jgi:hypothetical protein
MRILSFLSFLSLFGLLSLLSSSSLSAQTQDNNFVSEYEISDVFEPTAFECLMFAQATGDKPPMRGEGRMQRRMEQGRQRKYLEQLRMLKMLELLELAEDQEVEFLTAYNAMRREHRDFDEQINASLDTLSRELKASDPTDETITRLCQQVSELDYEKNMIRAKFARKAEGVLSIQQMGRLVIFQKRFESEMLENIGRFRRGGGRGPSGLPQGEG